MSTGPRTVKPETRADSEDRLVRSRRWFLRMGTLVSGALAACRPSTSPPPGGSTLLGRPIRPYGDRSRFEKALRVFRPSTTNSNEAASSFTPLQDLYGIITPSSLHFERHHAGVPDIDPAEHRLLIHGLVDRPLVLTVDEIKRFPSVSPIYFLECSGNSNTEWTGLGEKDLQRKHGLTSCSQWTGVPLAILLREAGVRPEGSWILAEGADACKMTRSLPMDKAVRDVLVAYGQNGEALRPEQGYPLRLLVPGWEGNINVKWLRRLKVVDKPYMTREETSKYTDLMPDGSARQFTFVMDAKSLITRPSAGQRLPGPGVYELTGLAWSGRGAITRVDITTDGGRSWREAALDDPRLPIAHTRFRSSWVWDGRETVLQSRCADDTGYVQPTRAELVVARGVQSNYHFNAIQGWRVDADGSVRAINV